MRQDFVMTQDIYSWVKNVVYLKYFNLNHEIGFSYHFVVSSFIRFIDLVKPKVNVTYDKD